MIGEYILIVVLILSAIFLVVAVLFQKSEKDGLSGTIAGGAETYYGKDKSVGLDRKLRKWTAVIGIVFALAVIAVYVLQPDYTSNRDYLDAWTTISEYSSIFK